MSHVSDDTKVVLYQWLQQVYLETMKLLKRSNSDVQSNQLPTALAASAAAQSVFAASTPVEELRTLDELADLVVLNEGDVIVDNQALGQYCVFVLDGQLDVYRDGDRFAEVLPGWFAGEMSIRHQQRRNATVVARTDAVVYRLSRGDFDTLYATCPAVQAHIDQTIKARMVNIR